MVPLITMGYHARYYSYENQGRKLPVLLTTANGRDECFDYDNIRYDNAGVYEGSVIKLYQYVSHGETWANKGYLLSFVDTTDTDGEEVPCVDELPCVEEVPRIEYYEQFGSALVGFYSNFKSLTQLDQLDGKSRIAYRYSGFDFMTPEERLELILNREWFFRASSLAKVMSENSPTWTRDALVNLDDTFRSKNGLKRSELLAMYDRFLAKKEPEALVEDLKKVLDDHTKGFFKFLDGFGDILGSIFANEEDVKLSIEDEKKYSQFRHSFDAALILKEGLDKSDTLIESEVQSVFTEIDKVFEKDYATGEKIADPSKNARWTRFFTRFEKLTGIGLLVKARDADIDNKGRAKGRNRFAHLKRFGGGGGDGDSDSS